MPTVLITGSNRGLGLEFARQYAADGWDVIACCRDPKKAGELQALAAKNSKIRVEALDVGDFDAIKKFAAGLKGEAIDVLINNAGILSGTDGTTNAVKGDASQSFGSVDAEGWLKVMRVNALAPLKMTEAFADHVARSAQKKIVMISSGWGSIANMNGDFYAYKTSKAALNAITKNLAADLKDEKICVVAFSPGWVQTDMGSQEATFTPEESVGDMRKTIANLTLNRSGQFLAKNGDVSPW